MLKQIWAISWVDIYNTFTDRGAIMINIAAPLAISIIIAAAFGGGANEIDLREAKVGIITQDNGLYGALYACLLDETPEPEIAQACRDQFGIGAEVDTGNDQPSISEFVDGQLLDPDEVNRGRRMVREGDLDVLLVVPPNYSNAIIASDTAALDIYYNPGGGIPVDVARSIIQGINDQFNTAAIAGQLIPAYAQSTGDDIDVFNLIGQIQQEAFTRSAQDIIQLDRVNVEGESEEFDALQFFAPSMAIFFLTFGMAAGARSILEDMRNWTMQRIVTTPMPRWGYMAGKTIGTYVSGIFQMTILIVTTLLVSTFVFGNDIAIWGSDVVAIILLVMAVVLAATGLGMVIAAFGKNPEQVQALSTVVLIILAAVGGTFLPVDDVPVVKDLQRFTLNYWGLNGFTDMSLDGGTLASVLDNILILLLMGIVMLFAALILFGRREDFREA